MRPRIAIPFPTSADVAYNQRSWHQYAEAVSRSGGEPVGIPLTLTETELRTLIASCLGVLLPGSPADVNPARYGAERDPASAPPDLARETVDFALLDDAQRSYKPVVGICFGCQSLNVWRGGTLVQDLRPVPVNHAAGAQVAVAHTALVRGDSILAAIADTDETTHHQARWEQEEDVLRLPVNSSHHQAIGIPGDGLRVTARCPEDGVVEAIEFAPEVFHVEHPADKDSNCGPMFHVEHSRSSLLLGVQWHPERSYDISATSRNLFHRLVADAARLSTWIA